MQSANISRWKALHRFGPPTLITLGVLWLLQGALAHTGNHGVIIRNLNYDAGTVKAGSTVMDTVRIINLSTGPIWVDAQPGCSCTVADTPIKPVAILHSGIIKVEINTEGMGKGLQEKGVLLKLQNNQKMWEQLATIRFQLN